jgi:hypothetical protein
VDGGHLVPVVLQTTKGRCSATATSCELLPESWPRGKSELPPGAGWINLGDYHSHPDFGVFMSGPDCASFWAWGHVRHWVGCVIDPVRGEIGMFVKRSATDYRKVETVGLSDRRARALGEPIGVSR